MTTGILIALALLLAVLVGFWLMGRHWSHVPPKPKPVRRRSTGDWRARARWFAIWWTFIQHQIPL